MALTKNFNETEEKQSILGFQDYDEYCWYYGEEELMESENYD